MSTYESPAQCGAIERPASQTNYVDYIAPRLSDAASKWLEAWCDSIADCSVSLAQLPLPVVSIYLLGYAHAEHRYVCNHVDRIARLEWEVGYWHFLATNRGKTGADFYRHAESELWRQEVAA